MKKNQSIYERKQWNTKTQLFLVRKHADIELAKNIKIFF